MEIDCRLVHKGEVGSTPTQFSESPLYKASVGVRVSRGLSLRGEAEGGGGQSVQAEHQREFFAGSTAPTRQCEGGALPSCRGTTAALNSPLCTGENGGSQGLTLVRSMGD